MPWRTAPWHVSHLSGWACHSRPGRSQWGAAAPGGRALGQASVHTPPRAPAAYVPHPCEVSSYTSQQTGPLRPRPCTGARPARVRRRGHTIRLRPVPRLGPRRLPRRPGSADPAGERTRHPAFWGASSHGAGYDPPVLAGTRRSGRLGTQKNPCLGSQPTRSATHTIRRTVPRHSAPHGPVRKADRHMTRTHTIASVRVWYTI